MTGPPPAGPRQPGRLVLAGAPLGGATDACPGLGEALASTPTWSRPRTPGGCAGWRPTWGSVSGPGAVVLRGQRAGRMPRAGRASCGPAGRPAGHRRRDAERVRPRLPAGRRRRRGRRAGDRAARARRRSPPRSRVSGLPVDRFCFEGFLPRKPGEPAARAGRAGRRARGRMVFFEAPHRLAATLADAGRGARPGPAGRGLPGADQDLRGGAPGHAGRAGRLGGRTASGARSRWWSAVRRAGSRAARSRPSWPSGGRPSGSRPGRAARRRSPRWPRPPGWPGGVRRGGLGQRAADSVERRH